MKTKPNRYYTALAIALALGLGIFFTGMWFNGAQYCYGGTVCTYFKTLDWESLCAGLFGLAGGLAVIAVSKEQIGETKENAIKERLFEVDSVIIETEVIITKITDQVSEIRTGKTINNPQRANEEYKNLKSTASNIPEDIKNIITANKTLPISLRKACESTLSKLYPIANGHIHFYASPADQASVDRDVQELNDIINKACVAISHCKSERDRYAEILRKR